MKCPKCGEDMIEEHDRGYDGKNVQFWYFWSCPNCGYVHNMNSEDDWDE